MLLGHRAQFAERLRRDGPRELGLGLVVDGDRVLLDVLGRRGQAVGARDVVDQADDRVLELRARGRAV